MTLVSVLMTSQLIYWDKLFLVIVWSSDLIMCEWLKLMHTLKLQVIASQVIARYVFVYIIYIYVYFE